MIKLTKTKPNNPWENGNHFGGTTAEWVVKKAPAIAIREVGTMWIAVEDGARIADSFTRAMLLEKLEEKRPELAS